MTRLQYWLINSASLLVALLIALEVMSVHQLDNTTLLVQKAQAPLLQAQRDEPQIQRLVQRTAVGATRDPAIKDLLAKYGVIVKPTSGDGASDANAPLGAPANASSLVPAPVSTASVTP